MRNMRCLVVDGISLNTNKAWKGWWSGPALTTLGARWICFGCCPQARHCEHRMLLRNGGVGGDFKRRVYLVRFWADVTFEAMKKRRFLGYCTKGIILPSYYIEIMTNHYQDPCWTTSHTTKIFVQQPLWKDTVGGFDHCATGSPKNPSISYIFESTRFQGQWKRREPGHIFHRYRRKPEGHGHGSVRNDVVQHIGMSWWWKFASPNYKRCENSQIYRPKTYQKGLSDQGDFFFSRGTFTTFSTKPPRGWPFHR